MAEMIAKSFQARLERIDSPLKWVMIRIPFDVVRTWGMRGQVKVKGEINGFAFRTSLFPKKNGGHMLLVNKRMQRGGKVAPGAVARFRLEPDTEERIVSVPPELKRAFAEERSILRWFNKLNYSTRKALIDVIAQVKSADARARRADQVAEQLLATLEAERELPPILQLAFARNSAAREGWERMSPGRRRGHLLGIFYQRSPDSRARRVAKAVEDAVEFERKATSKGIGK